MGKQYNIFIHLLEFLKHLAGERRTLLQDISQTLVGTQSLE